MIDIENDVFRLVATKLRAKVNPIYVTGEYVKAPPKFPCVTLVAIDNRPVISTQTTSSMENHVHITFEINVYSNKSDGKKSECKSIIKIVDDVLLNLGFNRLMIQPIQNNLDATIYRMVGRYSSVVSTDGVIFRG